MPQSLLLPLFSSSNHHLNPKPDGILGDFALAIALILVAFGTRARTVARAPGVRQALSTAGRGLRASEGAGTRLGTWAARGIFREGSRGAQAVARFSQTGSVADTFGASRSSRNLLMVGPESEAEFSWLTAQGEAGWETTAVNPLRTPAATSFETSGGRFMKKGVEELSETFNWTHESFPLPLGRTNLALEAYSARLNTLAPGGRLTILTDSEELMQMYQNLTIGSKSPFTFSQSPFTPAHPQAGSLPPATSTHVAPGSPRWLLDIFYKP